MNPVLFALLHILRWCCFFHICEIFNTVDFVTRYDETFHKTAVIATDSDHILFETCVFVA